MSAVKPAGFILVATAPADYDGLGGVKPGETLVLAANDQGGLFATPEEARDRVAQGGGFIDGVRGYIMPLYHASEAFEFADIPEEMRL